MATIKITFEVNQDAPSEVQMKAKDLVVEALGRLQIRIRKDGDRPEDDKLIDAMLNDVNL